MTKRASCPNCFRPLKTCLCEHVQPVTTSVKLVVIQHSQEQKHPLNTAVLAKLCIPEIEIWQTDDFIDHPKLLNLLESGQQCYLVFPSETSSELTELLAIQNNREAALTGNIVFILLDGTWKKCMRMLLSSPALMSLPCIKLRANNKSNYRIRKSPNEQSLSTIECLYELLCQIELTEQKFQPLLDIFDQMINQQIAFMGEATYQKNYRHRIDRE